MAERDPLLDDPRIWELARARLEAARVRWRRDPLAFRMECRRVGPGRLRYRDTFAPWQEEHIFLPMDAGKSLWNESPRGHDRTDAEAWKVCEDLQHGPADQRIVLVAADADQARFPLDRARQYTGEDADLFPGIVVRENEILGPNRSKAVILSSDRASSLGEKPTMVYLDEIGVWPERSRFLKDAILGSATKGEVPIRVFTNALAGKVGNWRWDFREWFREQAARDPEHWHFWSAPGWVADWSRARRDLLRGAMSPAEARRFLDNVTLEQGENPAFDGRDIERIFGGPEYHLAADGKTLSVAGEARARPVICVVQASDYGLTNDALCCGAAALTAPDDAFLVDAYAAAGRPGDSASLLAAEEHMLGVVARWPVEATLIDPYQAVHTAQEHGPRLRLEEYVFTLQSKRRLYMALLARVRAGTFHARPGAFRRTHANGQEYDLRRELFEAVEKHGAAGSTMDHPEGGHDDAAVTCGMLAVKLGEVSLAPAAVYSSPRLARLPGRLRGPVRDPRSRFA